MQTKKVYGFNQPQRDTAKLGKGVKNTDRSKSPRPTTPRATTPLKTAKNQPSTRTPVKNTTATNLTGTKKNREGTTPNKSFTNRKLF